MPLEAIKCTNCGSVDFKEVKPSTYFCNSCDTVFKHVDPSRIKVDHTPSFCACGNLIGVHCGLCRTPMCWRCDAVQWRKAIVDVRTVGFGYRFAGLRRPLYGNTAWEIQAGRIVGQRDGASEMTSEPSLRMPHTKLLQTLDATHDGLLHVCFSCLARAVPETAERIATGAVCETPGCVGPPSGRCPCCHGAFCESCLSVPTEWDHYSSPTLLDQLGRPAKQVMEIGSEYFKTDYPKPTYAPRSPYDGNVTYPLLRSPCIECACERERRARAAAIKACEQQYAGVLMPNPDYKYIPGIRWRKEDKGWRFVVPIGTHQKNSKRRHAAESRAQDRARDCARELSAYLDTLLAANEVCEREQAVLNGEEEAEYVLVDERDRTAASAAPGVLETL